MSAVAKESADGLSGGRMGDVPQMFPWRNLLVVMLLSVAAAIPFLGKAYHIDDPTYLWTARQVLQKPLDFYGYDIHWYWITEPMHQAMQNPPLTGYFVALASVIVGWNETGQHAAFALWLVGLAAGVFVLARSWKVNPTIAALATVFTPGVLVSSTNVMCDVMLVCLWVWAMALWEKGLIASRWRKVNLFGAGVLIAMAALTKYFGVALVPLLALHAVMRTRRAGAWIFALLVPVAAMAAYDLWGRQLYGHSLILDASDYSRQYRNFDSAAALARHASTGLAFAGGCCAVILFFWWRLWPWWAVVVSVLAALMLAVLAGPSTPVDVSQPSTLANLPWGLMLQVGLWVTVGAGVLILPAADWWRNRDAIAATLMLWVWGTFVFATFINWSVTARTILPLIPAVGILIARRVAPQAADDMREVLRWRTVLPLGLAAGLAIVVAMADLAMANTARNAAREIVLRWGGADGTLWFQGHWGFQWYMQEAGAKPMEQPGTVPIVGDRIVIPYNNCNVRVPEMAGLKRLERLEYEVLPWLTTMGDAHAAGFYSSVIGPLPFAFGRVWNERYDVFEMQDAP